MLTMIVSASDDAPALARLLTALVPAVAGEVLADVVVRGAAGASLEIAEDAGATIADGPLFSEALALARGDWLAGLPLTAAFMPAWVETLAAHMAMSPAAPARLVAHGGLFARRGAEGWLVPRALAPSAGAAEHDLQRLARRRGAGRLRILAAG